MKKCRHERHVDEVCLDCGVKVGTCPHPSCGKTVAIGPDSYIAYHDFPEPCRALCPGSKYSSVEDVKRSRARS